MVARDGLTLGELPVGSRVGTGSPRRVAQLQALGLGLDVVGVRGNVDTRVAKVRSGELDAVLLARAGLARIGRLEEVTEVLDPLQMLPAPGQGALAIECRAGDDLAAALAVLDDPAPGPRSDAERAVLATLEGGCSAPIGALAEVVEGEDGEELWVRAVALSTDGELSVADVLHREPCRRRGRRNPVGERDARRRCSSADGHRHPEAERMTRGKTTTTAGKTTSKRLPPAGWVSFVGSGPGDPGLLTVRAVELLKQADVVVTEEPPSTSPGAQAPGSPDLGRGHRRGR